MISTILNELSVQIVSDFFPKPKAPPGVTMSITVHKPIPSFSFLPFSSLQLPFTKQIQISQAFCSFLFVQACLQANTNTNLTGILSFLFHPKPVLKQITITANTNADTKQIKATTKNNRQQAGGIRRTSGPSNGPHSPCPRPSSSRAPTCRSYSTRTTRSPSSRPEPQRSDQVARGAA